MAAEARGRALGELAAFSGVFRGSDLVTGCVGGSGGGIITGAVDARSIERGTEVCVEGSVRACGSSGGTSG